jgi:hypothetical protein
MIERVNDFACILPLSTKHLTCIFVTQELEGMLDDDQDMADMYLGRRQDAANTKEEERARRAIEPPSPTASAVSMDSLEAADFMGQSESDTEVPARPNRPTSPGDANFIRKSTPIQAQPPPQVCPSHKAWFLLNARIC